MAALLCGASIFGGPDVLRVGDEVASATGLQLAFGAQADWALSDEQVGQIQQQYCWISLLSRL